MCFLIKDRKNAFRIKKKNKLNCAHNLTKTFLTQFDVYDWNYTRVFYVRFIHSSRIVRTTIMHKTRIDKNLWSITVILDLSFFIYNINCLCIL